MSETLICLRVRRTNKHDLSTAIPLSSRGTQTCWISLNQLAMTMWHLANWAEFQQLLLLNWRTEAACRQNRRVEREREQMFDHRPVISCSVRCEVSMALYQCFHFVVSQLQSQSSCPALCPQQHILRQNNHTSHSHSNKLEKLTMEGDITTQAAYR